MVKNDETSLVHRYSWQRVAERKHATQRLQVNTFSERLKFID